MGLAAASGGRGREEATEHKSHSYDSPALAFGCFLPSLARRSRATKPAPKIFSMALDGPPW